MMDTKPKKDWKAIAAESIRENYDLLCIIDDTNSRLFKAYQEIAVLHRQLMVSKNPVGFQSVVGDGSGDAGKAEPYIDPSKEEYDD